MLSNQDNDLLCRVEGDAPMGKMLRQYWIPACRSESLVSDGEPRRIRLLGENYVAFRATDGKAGFIDEACPHRGCSLVLARNEECGLVCIFHGWKIDTTGSVVDVPTEENRYEFGKKFKTNHYPNREAGGILWVYLGTGEPPQFPEFEFTTLPESHVYHRVAYTNCNWVQSLEGTLDSAHVGVLHKTSVAKDPRNPFVDLAPKFEVIQQPYGITGCVVRNLETGYYVRLTEYVAPLYSLIPPRHEDTPILMTISVPVDDHNTAQWFLRYKINSPWDVNEREQDETYYGIGDNKDDFYNPQGTFENRWHQDRSTLHENFSGVNRFIVEDFIVQESMGTIINRSKENLGTTDTVIIQVRRLLLKSLKSFLEGHQPVGLDQQFDYKKIRSKSIKNPIGTDWREFV